MNWRREYEIAFVGLSLGEHQFNYQIKDSFFEHFAKPDFTESEIEVKLTLDKKPSAFLLHFEIHGKAKTICDRCGDDFDLRVWDEFDHVVKLVDDADVSIKNEIDPEVSYVSKLSSIFDVSKLVYEFVLFSFPVQRVHPTDENGNSTCNQEVIDRINKLAPNNDNNVWDALKNKIKNENE